MARKYSRRTVVAGALGAVAMPFARVGGQTRLVLNDASRLNPTPIAKHLRPRSDARAATIEALRAELKDAAATGRRVCVGAARHSMGGQSLPRDGVAITFDAPTIDIDSGAMTYRASAGARWSEVIAALDPKGLSPKVMQSNHDFAVASTFSVNAHGWPVPYGPFGSTVRSLRLMLASGDIVECSRDREPELFSLAMGGYGLFGIILDLDVEMVRNALLAPTIQLTKAEEFPKAFGAAIADPTALMAYGRLEVARASFFDEAALTTYRAVAPQPEPLPAATHGGGAIGSLTNDIYRAQIGNELAKRFRWQMETRVYPKLVSGVATRNSLMNEPVANLSNPFHGRTDILHEYFVSPDRFGAFLAACREIITPAKAEFLNVTLRYVAKDDTAALAFAPVPRIAAVMSFSQEISPEGEIDMLQMTERLIDRIVAIDGAFYLPYRLHARPDQVARVYPKTPLFVAKKREYDPRLVFRNAMWDAYFSEVRT